MSDELTQKQLDKECKYAKLDISDYHSPLIKCTQKVGHKDGVLGMLDLCIASQMYSPNQEYCPFTSSNHLPTMNKCEFKEPLNPDKERHQKRLYDQQMIYTKAARMQTKIDDRKTDDIEVKDKKDLGGMASLMVVNYLKSKDYESKNFKERLKMREDTVWDIKKILDNIEKNLEARM